MSSQTNENQPRNFQNKITEILGQTNDNTNTSKTDADETDAEKKDLLAPYFLKEVPGDGDCFLHAVLAGVDTNLTPNDLRQYFSNRVKNIYQKLENKSETNLQQLTEIEKKIVENVIFESDEFQKNNQHFFSVEEKIQILKNYSRNVLNANPKLWTGTSLEGPMICEKLTTYLNRPFVIQLHEKLKNPSVQKGEEIIISSIVTVDGEKSGIYPVQENNENKILSVVFNEGKRHFNSLQPKENFYKIVKDRLNKFYESRFDREVFDYLVDEYLAEIKNKIEKDPNKSIEYSDLKSYLTDATNEFKKDIKYYFVDIEEVKNDSIKTLQGLFNSLKIEKTEQEMKKFLEDIDNILNGNELKNQKLSLIDEKICLKITELEKKQQLTNSKNLLAPSEIKFLNLLKIAKKFLSKILKSENFNAKKINNCAHKCTTIPQSFSKSGRSY